MCGECEVSNNKDAKCSVWRECAVSHDKDAKCSVWRVCSE